MELRHNLRLSSDQQVERRCSQISSAAVRSRQKGNLQMPSVELHDLLLHLLLERQQLGGPQVVTVGCVVVVADLS